MCAGGVSRVSPVGEKQRARSSVRHVREQQQWHQLSIQIEEEVSTRQMEKEQFSHLLRSSLSKLQVVASLIQFYLFSDSVEIKSNHQTIKSKTINRHTTQYHMYALCIKRIQIPITIWVVPRVVCQ